MKVEGVIFDFNGVLFWDTHLHEEAWISCSMELKGKPLTSDEILKFVHGRTNKFVFEYMLNRPLLDHEVRALSQKKELLYRSLCLKNMDHFQLSPGAVEFLEYLRKNSIPFTIATASEKENLDFFIEHLRLLHWFDKDKIVYDDGSYHGKLGMFLKAAENLDLSPGQCMVIEDSRSGIAAAHAAKIGKIIGLGPKEVHGYLRGLEGVSEVITSLKQILP